MDSHERLRIDERVTIDDLLEEISDELVAACMGGVLVNQEAPIGIGNTISIDFENGQKFILELKEVTPKNENLKRWSQEAKDWI